MATSPNPTPVAPVPAHYLTLERIGFARAGFGAALGSMVLPSLLWARGPQPACALSLIIHPLGDATTGPDMPGVRAHATPWASTSGHRKGRAGSPTRLASHCG